MENLTASPSWQTVVLMCCEVLANPNAGKTEIESCKSELLRLAKIVDDHNEWMAQDRSTTLDVIIAEERAKGNML